MSPTDLEALACSLVLGVAPFLVALYLESLLGPYDKMTAEAQAAENFLIMIFFMVFALRLAFLLNPEAMS
jgi:hypothetical protein